MEVEIISRSHLFFMKFEVKITLAALPFTECYHWFLPLLFLQVLHLYVNIYIYTYLYMNRDEQREIFS